MHDTRDDIDTPAADPLNVLADRLRGWQPSTIGLDRDRLIYEVGRAAGLAEARTQFRRRLWPLAVAASLLLGISLVVTTRPRTKIAEPTRVEVAVREPQPSLPPVEMPPIAPVDPNSYLALARRIEDGSLESGQKATHTNSHAPASSNGPPPLRARDLDRLLNL